ncbi:MAG: amidohydrolase [Oscillospiraceae bacterium]|nr:amidohydrolase [Oscillospiraceae bacterium]
MKIRIDNARLLMPDLTVSEGSILTEDGLIAAVGDIPDGECDEVIDAHRNLVMPGFNDAHTHSAMTFLRSLADDLPLDRWLHESVFPREAKLTAEDIYDLTRLAVLEYLTSGITSCFDMYFFPDAFASALTDSGFRGVFCGSVTGDPSAAEKLEQDYLRFNGKDPLISYILGFHAEYTASEELLREVSALSHKYKAPVFSHSSETRSEVEGCISRHGATPTVYLDSLGLYDNGGGGFHCVHMTDEDIGIYRSKGLFAVTNPCSNAKLASGIAPLLKMHKSGVRLAVGTDGAASNNALDMFREMYLAAVLQKILCDDAEALPAEEVLSAALSGSADAMGINSGRLEAGRNADIIMIDLDTPNMQPINSIVRNIVYSGSKTNVKMTMVGGRILYRDGEFFVGESPEKIYEKANSIANRISSQM